MHTSESARDNNNYKHSRDDVETTISGFVAISSFDVSSFTRMPGESEMVSPNHKKCLSYLL